MWMLRRLVPGERNDALVGDLLEEFRSGRSAGWYWRQVLACLIISNKRVALTYTGTLLFASLWALLAPAWLPLTRLGQFPRLDHAILNLAWPWSILCELGLTFALLISFVWAGLLLYFVLESLTSSTFSFRRFRRGIMRSAAIFTPLWVTAWLILPLFGIHLPRRAAHDAFPFFMLTKPVFCIVFAPFFITLLWAVWDTSRIKHLRRQP